MPQCVQKVGSDWQSIEFKIIILKTLDLLLFILCFKLAWDLLALSFLVLPFEMGVFTLGLFHHCILEAENLFDLQVHSWKGICLTMN